jgi:16S rRNA (cytosine967-C5)-methyltransferase
MLILGAPGHGVVAESVRNSGRIPSGKSATGLVNAVLRKISDDGAARLQELAAPRLPGWLRGRLQNAYGDPATRAIEAVLAEDPPHDLTMRSGHALPDIAAEQLPTGSVRVPRGAQVSALSGYESGAFWVQDAAAALPVRALGDLTGLSVLDVCAAPGGKTLQLADAGAEVTALDISETRLKRLSQNLSRTGLSAEVIVGDALEWQPESPFDVVVLDAPCSATGTLRRHPDLPYLRDGKAVKDLAALQRALLDRVLEWLKPEGRLLFITCSLLPEEGEAHLSHPRLMVEPIDPTVLGGEAAWATPEGALRLRPDYWADRGGMDGFFAALFRPIA